MKFSMTEQDNGDRPGMFDCTVCIFLFMKFPFCLKAYRMSEFIFFYIKSCQYSMYYTNCS